MSIEQSKRRYRFPGDNLNDAINFVGDNAAFEIEAQPTFMKSVGLKSHHKFLDLACGCLRGTVRLIDYLDEGNFYGADISDGLIRMAAERAKSQGMTKNPTLVVMPDYDLEKILPKMDFILSVSLHTHLLPDDLAPLFSGVAKILKPEGIYYFTMYPTTDGSDFQGNIDIARHSKQSLIRAGASAGLIVEDIEGDWTNPSPVPNYIDRVNVPTMAQWVMKARLA